MCGSFKNKILMFYGPDRAFDFHKGNNTEMMINCPIIPPVGIQGEKTPKNLKLEVGANSTGQWFCSGRVCMKCYCSFFFGLLLLRIFVHCDHDL